MPRGMQAIYTQTIGAGGVAGVTFNNIPQTYTDLKIIISARGASGNFTDVLPLTINGNYNLSVTHIQGYNNVTASFRSPSSASYGTYLREPASTATATTFSNTEIYIPNYSSSGFKSFIIDNTSENNSATDNYTLLGAGLYPYSNPVKSLGLLISNGAIVQNSTFTVYGIGR
jgi:hypothetical protein